jgi:hypothetical protein
MRHFIGRFGSLRAILWLTALTNCNHLSWAQTKPADADPLAQWVTVAEKTVPTEASKFTAEKPVELAKAAEAIELWVIQKTTWTKPPSVNSALETARQVLDAKQRIDRLLARTLELRTHFIGDNPEEANRDAMRSFLRCTSGLINLSGRLRYLQFDALTQMANLVVTSTADRQRLVALLTEYRSSVGASVAANFLFATSTPPSDEPHILRGSPAIDDTGPLKAAVLRLFAATGDPAHLTHVAKYLTRTNLAPDFVLIAAETIRQLGLPQSPRPDTPADLPRPAITPQQLRDRLAMVFVQRLTPEQKKRHAELTAWVNECATRGLNESSYRYGKFEVQLGDWLLMRNPSPYNLFTDLSPGLFTHVGVVTTEKAADGVTRMVIVDMPERGVKMPATNVEVFLERTLHYVFLRHPDPAAAEAMGQAARQMIGNEIEFDLNFRTDRVLPLKGEALAGKKIKTYCAGLLLLCALQTSHERGEFFPLSEYTSSGQTAANIGKLGMSVGDNFVSPTGCLFSPRMQFVGTREPMYDPTREIEEAIFDHFASRLANDELHPTPDLFHALQIKVAEASRQSRLLSGVAAAVARVNPDMDLVTGARAAAVVDVLDEIAFGSSAEFNTAREAIRGGSVDALRRAGTAADKVAAADKYRRRHADLVRQFESRQLSPRQLRVKLVEYYSTAGKGAIDRRFFSGEPGTEKNDNIEKTSQ